MLHFVHDKKCHEQKALINTLPFKLPNCKMAYSYNESEKMSPQAVDC